MHDTMDVLSCYDPRQTHVLLVVPCQSLIHKILLTRYAKGTISQIVVSHHDPTQTGVLLTCSCKGIVKCYCDIGIDYYEPHQ